MPPLLILLVGMATILVAIVALRLNAFLALIVAAIVVSLLAPGEAAVKVARVAAAFGRTAGAIGIVIALAAVIGAAMLESGAADRIVRAFLGLLGEKRGAAALCATGWVLSIAVFFDTVFYLLVPLARSMRERTGRQYLKYLMAIAAGAAATHTLVPPTPGPLAVAGALGVDLGTMILVGIAVSLPAAAAGLVFAGWVDRRMPVDHPREPAGAPAATAAPPDALPGLLPAVLPIALPVVLISSNTVVRALSAASPAAAARLAGVAPAMAILGDPNLALLLAAGIALWVFIRRRRATRESVARLVERSLMGAGVIILITAAGGGFGATLEAARVGPAIQSLAAARGAGAGAGAGLIFLFVAFIVSSLIKIAQGSSTVAMITTAGMLAAMLAGAPPLAFHPAYLATATAGGSLVGTWMNDSGFWVFSRMGGVTEVEALKSWTPLSAVVGVTAMATTIVLALLLPLR
jgi:GntP family gluconate:H+ symporter